MATTLETPKTTTSAAPAAPIQNWDAAKARLQQAREHAMTFQGKEGHNPFMYINEKILPLERALAETGESNDLYTKIMALDPKAAPVANMALKPTIYALKT